MVYRKTVVFEKNLLYTKTALFPSHINFKKFCWTKSMIYFQSKEVHKIFKKKKVWFASYIGINFFHFELLILKLYRHNSILRKKSLLLKILPHFWKHFPPNLWRTLTHCITAYLGAAVAQEVGVRPVVGGLHVQTHILSVLVNLQVKCLLVTKRLFFLLLQNHSIVLLNSIANSGYLLAVLIREDLIVKHNQCFSFSAYF